MSDNWVVQNLQNALETWNEKLAEIWQLITTTPQDFKGGGIWGVIVNINGAVQSIGLALLVLFFVAGMVKTCGSFTEVKKPEHALKLFVRFAIAKGAITYGMELISTVNKKRITSSWEQRKFSELVQIERGGSPRPIDDFITDAPNGLNWVKIGDAPTQGNYITKTAEKIRPEGLSKTREVHPGDLILSNSMSFGKPYIMGIDGCIHDGWLLIRNTYGVFDLTFLCHLLGTPQMLSQYRSLAAGSTVNNLNKELVGNTVVTIPSITEQRVLGDSLEQLDNLITLHQRKLDEMKKQKKALMQLLLTGIVRVRL